MCKHTPAQRTCCVRLVVSILRWCPSLLRRLLLRPSPAPPWRGAAMRLALVSDVHADHWKPVGAPLLWKRAPLADVLLVAGDLHDYPDGTADELRKAALVRCARAGRGCRRRSSATDRSRAHGPRQRYPLVVWVDGNHEGYTHGADLAASARHAAGARAARRGTRLEAHYSLCERTLRRRRPPRALMRRRLARRCPARSAGAARQRCVPRHAADAAARRRSVCGRVRVVGLRVLRA